MSSNWPEPLKLWVAQCLNQMTDSNRDDAQKELRDMIRQSYTDGSMWTRDWSKAKLKSLEPKTFNKRKITESTFGQTTPSTKKAKKSSILSTTSTISFDDQDKLQQRARRFGREWEIDRQKKAGLLPTEELSRHVNHSHSATPPPFYATSNGSGGGLESRMEGLTTSSSLEFRSGKSQSRRKYLNSSVGYSDQEGGNDNSNVVNWDRFTIVGTSENLFKNYLRLTSEPDPRDIRPYQVLTRTLAELKARWKKEQNYPWICDQFKSLRQDLTVQRIKNEFTVQVYEIHARMALEMSDLVEYNQCQSTLRILYELGIPGKREEFLAYRILYLLHVRNRSDLNRLISTLTPQVKSYPAVKHALDVQRAMATSNYHSFFVLFNEAPNMGGYIMDHFVERERLGALCIMSKAYITLPLSFISKELAFETPLEAHEFLFRHGAACYAPSSGSGTPGQGVKSQRSEARVLDCKAAHQPLLRTYEEKTRRVAIQGAI